MVVWLRAGKGLLEQFTLGDPDVTQSLRNLYTDQANWPAEFQQQMEPFRNPRVWESTQRALGWSKAI
jgi:hypothetical protein